MKYLLVGLSLYIYSFLLFLNLLYTLFVLFSSFKYIYIFSLSYFFTHTQHLTFLCLLYVYHHDTQLVYEKNIKLSKEFLLHYNIIHKFTYFLYKQVHFMLWGEIFVVIIIFIHNIIMYL